MKHALGFLVTVAALASSSAATAQQALDPDQVMELARRCAPAVAPTTMVALVMHESGGDPWAIGVNTPQPHPVRPASQTAAASAAAKMIEEGAHVDVGLGQINSENFKRLGLDSTSAFDPCKNMAAAAKVLTDAYSRLRQQSESDQAGLNKALSTYNTGSPTKGVRNGYVGKVRSQRFKVPALTPTATTAEPVAVVHATRKPAPAWSVYGHDRAKAANPKQSAVLVLRGSPECKCWW